MYRSRFTREKVIEKVPHVVPSHFEICSEFPPAVLTDSEHLRMWEVQTICKSHILFTVKVLVKWKRCWSTLGSSLTSLRRRCWTVWRFTSRFDTTDTRLSVGLPQVKDQNCQIWESAALKITSKGSLNAATDLLKTLITKCFLLLKISSCTLSTCKLLTA